MNKIITIGREFGSGGREFGRRLAEILRIAYYDQEIITEIADQTELSEQYVRNIVEKKPLVSFPIHTGRTFSAGVNPVFEQSRRVFQKQCDVIREMADKSDCVIVGRCADYILRSDQPYRIFLYAGIESRIERCRAKEPEHGGLSEKELRKRIQEVDRQRSRYYEFYTGQTWGERMNYDLSMNMTDADQKDVAEAMAKFLTSVYFTTIE